jgi:hypothetical protein
MFEVVTRRSSGLILPGSFACLVLPLARRAAFRC